MFYQFVINTHKNMFSFLCNLEIFSISYLIGQVSLTVWIYNMSIYIYKKKSEL